MQPVVVLLLAVLVAVASATTAEFIDDFSFTTLEFGIFTGDFPNGQPTCTSAANRCTKSSVICDPKPQTNDQAITGGTREVRIVGFPTPSCSMTAVVFNGTFSASVGGIGCGGTVTTRYDGRTNCNNQNEAAIGSPRGAGYPGEFTEDFLLGINLLSEAFAFQLLARADHPVPLRITVWQSASLKSTVGQTVNTPQNQVNQFTTFTFPFSGFDNQNVLANAGAIDFSFDISDNIQCQLAEFDVLVPDTASICGTVFGDCNCNLIQESGDSSISGVSVSLSGASSSQTTTGTNGNYCFTGLSTGVQYSVSVPSTLTLCTSSSNSNPRGINLPVGGVTNVNFAVQAASGVLSIPNDITVTCVQSTDPSNTGVATITAGSCGTSGTPTFSDSQSAGNCAVDSTITVISRTWSGAGTSRTQTIRVVDSRVAPSLTTVPTATVQCGGSTDPSSTGSAQATQNGCTRVTVSFTDSGSGSGSCDPVSCTRASSFVRTWTAVDLCGNAATPTQQTINLASCQTTCPTCPSCPPPETIPVTVPVTVAPRPPVGPLNCKFICDDADSSASAVAATLVALIVVVLAMF